MLFFHGLTDKQKDGAKIRSTNPKSPSAKADRGLINMKNLGILYVRIKSDDRGNYLVQ